MAHSKKYKLLFLLASLIYNLNVLSSEFLYPVAVTTQNNKTKIYVLHQKSINNIELWVWDPETKLCSQQCLLSSYMPVSLKILPNGDGFSFIDDGRIRIKKFDKRSPKSIDIYEPVYDISQINWIDEYNFYVSAKKNNKFCIFHINENGLIKTILEDLQDTNQDLSQDLVNQDLPSCNVTSQDFTGRDFMYPQKVGDSLFFIERVTQDGNSKKEHVSYKIARTVYPDLCQQMHELTDLIENSDDFDFKTKKIQEFTDNCESQNQAKKNCEYLADFKNNPIAFLSMISETEGFFLKHQENICKHDQVVTFECFGIKQEGEIWENKKLFSFSVPAYLILGVPDSCLYESILPLIPKYYNNKIYFVNFDTKNQSLDIFSYNFISKKTEKKYFLQDSQLLFSPVFVGDIAFLGGKIDFTENCPVKMWIGEGDLVFMDLPKILV